MLHPRLTFLGYGQLFSAYGRYEGFFQAASAGAPIRLRDLVPTAEGHPGFHNAGLNLSLVVRWEYRLGSTLYAVYTHAAASLPIADAEEAPATLAPRRLFEGPAVDGFLVKWSYWWDLCSAGRAEPQIPCASRRRAAAACCWAAVPRAG